MGKIKNTLTRLAIYLLIITILITTPLRFPKKTDTKTSRLTSNSVKISLVNQSVAKAKTKPRPKPQKKKKKVIKQKPKPKKPPKTLLEKKPETKPVKEVFEKEDLLPQVKEQISEPTINKAYEIRQTYYSYIRSTIEQNQIYPKKARRFKHQGVVEVSFMIRYDGSVDSLEILKPSRYNTLNKAVKQMFKKLKFEKPPKYLESPMKISIPIKFTLTGGNI